MSKISFADAISGFNLQALNENFEKLEGVLQDEVLYRKNPNGEPNQMETGLDMNSQPIYNLPAPGSDHEAARLKDVTDAIAGHATASLTAFAPYKDINATSVQGAIQQALDITRADFQVVATVAALRAVSKASITKVFVQGALAKADGGGGSYYYDSTDTTTADNGVTVVVGNDGGRWKLLNLGRNSGKHYAEQGATVHRFGDRMFIGEATKNLGTNVGLQPDWLTTYLLGKGRTFAFQQVTTQAVLTAADPASCNALLAGARTSPFTGAGNAIGVLGVAINDNTTQFTGAYGGYFEGFQNLGATGPAYGTEIDIMNFGTTSITDPYQQASNQTIGLQLASGGEFAANEASAAINIRNNGASYLRGLVFGSDAISGATGSTGTGTAIAFGKGHTIQWFAGAGVGTSSIVSYNSTALGSVSQVFGEYTVGFNNQAGKTAFQIALYPNAVNYMSIRGTATGSPAQMQAGGDDTNVGIQLIPKGTEYVWFGSYTASALATTGYISIKDAGGAVRRLLVG